MKELILDLRDMDTGDPEDNAEFADMPARTEMESMLLDYAGKVIRVKATVINQTNTSYPQR